MNMLNVRRQQDECHEQGEGWESCRGQELATGDRQHRAEIRVAKVFDELGREECQHDDGCHRGDRLGHQTGQVLGRLDRLVGDPKAMPGSRNRQTSAGRSLPPSGQSWSPCRATGNPGTKMFAMTTAKLASPRPGDPHRAHFLGAQRLSRGFTVGHDLSALPLRDFFSQTAVRQSSASRPIRPVSP
jgi:hypothetical protein